MDKEDSLNINGNMEIEKALKEFEMKSNVEQAQETPKDLKTSNIPKMVQLVIKWSGGLIKEQRQAEYILLGFVIISVIFSIFMFFRSGPKNEPPNSSLIEQAGSPSEISF